MNCNHTQAVRGANREPYPHGKNEECGEERRAFFEEAGDKIHDNGTPEIIVTQGIVTNASSLLATFLVR